MAVQNEWRHCAQCMGLWFAGDVTEAGRRRGVCPAGGAHRVGDADHTLLQRATAPSDEWEAGWRRCTDCAALFQQRPGSACPARGGREHVMGAAGFCLAQRAGRLNAPARHWYRCGHCEGLFWAPRAAPGSTTFAGRCPGRSGALGHESADDREYFLLTGVGRSKVVSRTHPPPMVRPSDDGFSDVPRGSDEMNPSYLNTLAVHAALLPLGSKGRVLYFAGTNFLFDRWADRTFLWTPPSVKEESSENISSSEQIRTFQPGGPLNVRYPHLPPFGHDLFCAGHALLPDGSLLAAGGTSEDPDIPNVEPTEHAGHYYGLIYATVFTLDVTRASGRWWRAPDMRHIDRARGREGGRWYPTLVTLADGTVLMLGGHPLRTDPRHTNWWIERYVPRAGAGENVTKHPTTKDADPQPKLATEPLPGTSLAPTVVDALARGGAGIGSRDPGTTLDPSALEPRPSPARPPLLMDPRSGRWEYLGDEPRPVRDASSLRRMDLTHDTTSEDEPLPLHDGTPDLYPRVFALPDGDVLCTRLVGQRDGYVPTRSFFTAGAFEDKTWRFHPFVAASGAVGALTTFREVAIAPKDLPPTDQRILRDDGRREDAYSVYYYLESAAMLPLRERDGFDTSILQVGGLAPWRLDLGPRAERATAEWVRSGWRLLMRPASGGRSYRREALRRHCTAVLTPDGRVLVVGGNDADGAGTNSSARDVSGVRAVEQYDPREQRWSTLASTEIVHGYHHTALLLPDGRIFVSGNVQTNLFPPEIEAFSPPYLFRRSDEARPRITALSASRLAPGDTLRITTPDAAAIETVSLVRFGSVTHGFNADQRCVVPEIHWRGRDWVQVRLPDALVAIPGWYMVFVLDYLEVPSLAKFLQVVPDFGPLVAATPR